MVFKKLIFQNRYVELETPPPLQGKKNILIFHFDYLNISLIFIVNISCDIYWKKTDTEIDKNEHNMPDMCSSGKCHV